MEKILEVFCSRFFENDINKGMLYCDYDFPAERVLSYIQQIVEIPIEQLLFAIEQWEDEEQIQSGDIFQFSNLNDATYRICHVIKAADNPGITFLEAGKLLLNDGKVRKNTAMVKYGENHLKTAESLGLLYELTHVYFLSCIGYVTDLLNDNQREKLLLRLVLRNKLVRALYLASKNGTVNLRQFFYMLSDSTYTRRRSNVRSILSILEKNKEFDFSQFISAISFD